MVSCRAAPVPSAAGTEPSAEAVPVVESVPRREPLAALALTDANPASATFGQTVRVRDGLAEGQRVILSFYASWCQPCFDEMPVLVAADAAPDVTVLLLGLDGDRLFTNVEPSEVELHHRETAKASRLAFLGRGDESEEIYRLYLEVGYGITDDVAPIGELAKRYDVQFSVPLTVTLDAAGAVVSQTGQRLDEVWLRAVTGQAAADGAPRAQREP